MARGQTRNISTREQDIGIVEVDATFGRMLGFVEGQKVSQIEKHIKAEADVYTGWYSYTFGPTIGTHCQH